MRSSRTLNAVERNSSSFMGEMLGVCWALRLFRGYLYGAPFDVYTDHKPLVWLQHNYKLTSKHARWFMTIQDFSFRLFHRAGKDHTDADYLSRYALQGDHDSTGARVDFCLTPAMQCSAVFNPDTTTFDSAYTNTRSTYVALSECEYAYNPAALYMGTSRLKGETEHITAIHNYAHLREPRASIGLRRLPASMAPSVRPAPTTVWISSMNRTTCTQPCTPPILGLEDFIVI